MLIGFGKPRSRRGADPRARAPWRVVTACCAVAAACSGTPAPVDLGVESRVSVSVAALRFVACEGNRPPREHVFVPPLEPGVRRFVALPRRCVDLRAHDASGRVLAELSDFTPLPGSVWTIESPAAEGEERP